MDWRPWSVTIFNVRGTNDEVRFYTSSSWTVDCEPFLKVRGTNDEVRFCTSALWTIDYGPLTFYRGLWTVDCGLPTQTRIFTHLDSGLWTVDCRRQMHITKKLFTELGGEFCTDATALKKKLLGVKAYIFDWDGVFNDGSKNENGSSNFGEPDAMGTNLLRFNHWLLHRNLPVTAIISGERNTFSFQYARREKLHAAYFKASHKKTALDHFVKEFHIKPEEIAFVYDDVLDLSLAQLCGVRIMINRKASPLFKNYVIKNDLADYITANEGGTHGVREACELMIGLSGDYDTTIKHRINFSDLYQQYLSERSQNELKFFTNKDGQIESIDESCL